MSRRWSWLSTAAAASIALAGEACGTRPACSWECDATAADATVGDTTEVGPRDVAWDLRHDNTGIDGEEFRADVVEVTCEGVPASGPPPGVGRSCDVDAGVDPGLCMEVHYCGGVFEMGSPLAWWVVRDSDRFALPMSPSEVHQTVVQSGYVDAYEVTVGRLRRWVDAGMPHPGPGERFFDGHQWPTGNVLSPIATAAAGPPGPGYPDFDLRSCTYTDTLGPDEDRPANCVPYWDALAFCWWDGKHLLTEGAWEYLARNGATTDYPWGSIPGDPCVEGDFGDGFGLCGHEARPSFVGTHRLGDTLVPPGIHDLFGSVAEMVLGQRDPYCQPGTAFNPCAEGGIEPESSAAVVSGIIRGTSWLDDSRYFEWMANTRSRIVRVSWTRHDGGVEYYFPFVGFRCGRWEHETTERVTW